MERAACESDFQTRSSPDHIHEFAHTNMAHPWMPSGTFIIKHLYFFIAASSLLANNIANANAAASAIGPAYITPSIPIINEKITISGKRNSTCLVRDITIPSFAFPIDVKNPEDIG